MNSLAHTFFTMVEDLYNTHKNTKDIEMEMRIGKKRSGKFDTSIPKDVWDKVKCSLDKYEGWESIDLTKHTVFRGAKGIRLTEDENGDRTCIRKTTRENREFAVDKWCIRFSASVEKPMTKEPEEFDDIFTKERWSYLRKGVRIDLTELSPEDKDAEEKDHQIELELVNLTDDRETLFKQLYKVFDILKIIIPHEDPLWAIKMQ